MKVIYLVTTLRHGIGGHIYSLHTTADSLKDEIDIKIINIGIKPSPIFNDSTDDYQFIFCNGFNFLSVIKKLNAIIKNEDPSCLHAFDDKAFLFAKIVSYKNNIPVLLTKCGGENHKRYPYNRDIVLYSQENIDFYRSIKKFKSTRFHFIPNRVTQFSDNDMLIKGIKTEISDKISFLRISRISTYYENSILQSIRLIEQLVADGYKSVVLVIVGVVESPEVLRKISSPNVLLLTGNEYTKNAKELINAFDFVIGTGRGLMEAASKGKLLLSPSKYYKFPIFVDRFVFGSLLSTNFSERNNPDIKEEENYNKIVRCIDSVHERIDNSAYSIKMFDKHFNIKSVTDQYLKLYDNSEPAVLKGDTFYHFLFVIKEFLYFYIKS